jgi:hypothetical protein
VILDPAEVVKRRVSKVDIRNKEWLLGIETKLVVERYKNSDTTTVSGRDKLKVVVLLSRVERDKTLGEMSIPNSPPHTSNYTNLSKTW